HRVDAVAHLDGAVEERGRGGADDVVEAALDDVLKDQVPDADEHAVVVHDEAGAAGEPEVVSRRADAFAYGQEKLSVEVVGRWQVDTGVDGRTSLVRGQRSSLSRASSLMRTGSQERSCSRCRGRWEAGRRRARRVRILCKRGEECQRSSRVFSEGVLRGE